MTERLSEDDARYKLRFIGDESVFVGETHEKMKRIEALNPEAENTLYILEYTSSLKNCQVRKTKTAQ